MGWMIKAMKGLQSTFDGLTDKMNKEDTDKMNKGDYEIAEVDFEEKKPEIITSPWVSEWIDQPQKKNEVQNKLNEIIKQANGMMENFRYLTNKLKGEPKPKKTEEPNEEIKMVTDENYTFN